MAPPPYGSAQKGRIRSCLGGWYWRLWVRKGASGDGERRASRGIATGDGGGPGMGGEKEILFYAASPLSGAAFVKGNWKGSAGREFRCPGGNMKVPAGKRDGAPGGGVRRKK